MGGTHWTPLELLSEATWVQLFHLFGLFFVDSCQLRKVYSFFFRVDFGYNHKFPIPTRVGYIHTRLYMNYDALSQDIVHNAFVYDAKVRFRILELHRLFSEHQIKIQAGPKLNSKINLVDTR